MGHLNDPRVKQVWGRMKELTPAELYAPFFVFTCFLPNNMSNLCELADAAFLEQGLRRLNYVAPPPLPLVRTAHFDRLCR